ncbi:hypothetical protein GPECTOR_24g240 [Gonium pectorale]|uniref:Uncharacterized protein n=1 Tax=Gonium pectorale TaxID=33097 RepID=A0A150GHX5_GONPE|nr:hypothetical protein GPECTOR_24g240 [Gonium pectorale]|eukprot:KXZ48950.1 hypothetical protein GPECTOR_24g240 [Gonium pectorale]
MDKGAVQSLMAAATGLLPGQLIGEELSGQLSAILKPSLAKPRAFVSLSVSGLSASELGGPFANRQHRSVELTGDGCPAMAIVNGLSALSAANPNVPLLVLDHEGMQNCESGCIEQNLASAAKELDVDLSGLDLTQQEVKLFAVELAGVYAGVKNQLAAVQKRAELKVEQDDVELYEVSLMGLHGLVAKQGADSAAATAATNAVLRLLRWAVESIDAAYGGDAVYQVLLLHSGPARAQTVAQLAAWKSDTRRQLLTATYPPTDEKAAAKLFSTKAAGYGTFVLLVYFSLAAVYCMCYMPFKQDTLLYGSKKEQ